MLRVLMLLLLVALPCEAQNLTGGSFTNTSGLGSTANGNQLYGVVSGGTSGFSGGPNSQLQVGPVAGSGVAASVPAGAFGLPGPPPTGGTGGGGGGGGGCNSGAGSTGLPLALAWMTLLLGALRRRQV